jgi:hypothetical protein
MDASILGRSEYLAARGGPAHRALLHSPSPGPISSPALVVTAVVIGAGVAGASRIAAVHHKGCRRLLVKDIGDCQVSRSQPICLAPPGYDDTVKGCPLARRVDIKDRGNRTVGWIDDVIGGTTCSRRHRTVGDAGVFCIRR